MVQSDLRRSNCHSFCSGFAAWKSDLFFKIHVLLSILFVFYIYIYLNVLSILCIVSVLCFCIFCKYDKTPPRWQNFFTVFKSDISLRRTGICKKICVNKYVYIYGNDI